MTKINFQKINLVVLIAIVSLSSCAIPGSTLKPKEREVFTNVYDFRPYSQKGFYFSPNSYPGAFDPVAQIYLTVFPGTKEITEQTEDRGYGGGTDVDVKIVAEKITPGEMLEIIYNKAKELGGDGVVNFQMKSIYVTKVFAETSYQILDRYEIEGFAIKRK